jgi:ABC-type methionine transport system ATPase subunit
VERRSLTKMKTALACDMLSCRRSDWNNAGPSAVVSVTASFGMGEFYGFVGNEKPSKELLLNLLGLLEPPDAGRITVGERVIEAWDPEEIQPVRNEFFGFVFEHPCLLPSFSVAENVAMPLFRFCGGDSYTARKRTLEILDFCGITHLEAVLATRLDPVERRITALARALVHEPDVLIGMSSVTSGEILTLARRVATDLGLCVLWAGERIQLETVANRLLTVENGRISDEYP